MRVTLSLTTAVALGLAALPLARGWAQTNPNASQIIQSLTPNGNMTTRGIRLGSPPPAPARPGTPASTGTASTGTTSNMGTVVAAKPAEANLNVPFASGSSAISPAAARVLDELGKALTSQNLAEFKFRVEGHTDTVGAPDMNKALSEQRANSVTEYLASKFNIDRSRLTAVGMGEDGLLVQTGPGVANAANRRVLVVNLGS